MNGPSTNPENDLSSTLSRKADEFARRGGADLDLSQVVSRAGEIRRGRRMRATIAMAAVVLAVAVPVGVTVIANDPTGTRPIDPAASTTPAPTPSVVPAPAPDLSPLLLGDLTDGPAPATAYFADGKLYGGGQPVALPGDQDVVSLARIQGAFLVSRSGGTGWSVNVIDDSGSVQGPTWATEGGFAVSPGGEVGAFVEPDGTVIAVEQGGRTYVELPRIPEGSGFEAVAVTGESCDPTAADPCQVTVSSRGENPQNWTSTAGGQAEKVTGSSEGFRRISGISADGVIAGMTSVDDDGSCWEARDPGNGKALFATCDHTLLEFSPDGKNLLATTPYRDGFADPNAAVIALDGTVVLDLPGVVTGATWEDDEHLLVRIYDVEETSWAVLRVSLDGNREYAFGPVDTGADLPPIILGER